MYGGTLCGRAAGNVINFRDFEMNNPMSQPTIQGSVQLFVSNGPSTTLDVNSSALISVSSPCFPTMGPLLEYFTLPHTFRADPSKFGCILSRIW